jgi:hypothetical protein
MSGPLANSSTGMRLDCIGESGRAEEQDMTRPKQKRMQATVLAGIR